MAVDPHTLPLVSASLDVDAGGGLARVVLEQRFRNPHTEPLVVEYSLPLPHDAAVSGFAFRIGERRIVGEIDTRGQARERFERALMEGHTAALLEQDRTSVFTQQLGNVPPGAEVVAEITLDQKLAWNDEGTWEWRFPTTVAPRYLGAAGRVRDAARITQDVADARIPVRLTFGLRVRDDVDSRLFESPSHSLRATGSRVEQADRGGVPLDRDVVVRWGVAGGEPGVRVESARGPKGEAYALLTLVPPRRGASTERIARDVVLLLDVSGSMSGGPIEQARRVVSALVATLGPGDSLEMIAFASSARRWRKGAARATDQAKTDAQKWIAGLTASGSTEMRHAIEEALAPLRGEAQRQVVVVTDGQIGFEAEVLAAIVLRLPAQSRVHVVGVGSAPNRTLTAGASRAGRGVEVLVGLGEDAERAARRIVACTDAPMVVDLSLAGEALRDHAPARLPDLFAGAPALIALRSGEGELVVRGRTAQGDWKRRVHVPGADPTGRSAIPALYARERVEDLETELAAAGDAEAIDANIERVGLDFGIATRMTSWVAVSGEPAVDPGAPLRRERMPHELPHGTSVEGLGLRPPGLVGAPRMASMAMPRRTRSEAPGRPSPAELGAPAAGSAGPPRRVPKLGRLPGAVGAYFRRQGAAEPLQVRGRVTLRDAEGVVLELTLAASRAWTVPATAVVTWDDGTTTEIRVRADRSTRAGAVQAGAGVRLALKFDDARGIASIAFEEGGTLWVVTL